MKRNVNLILALSFLIPAIILFVMLGFHISRKIIITTGTEVDAEVVSISSNVTENNIDLYKIKFLYYDTNGNEHYGTTTSKYYYKQVQDMQTVKIKYNSSFKSIEADYKLDTGRIIGMVFLGIFTFIDVVIWVAFIKDVKQKHINKVLLTSGYETIAEFLPLNKPSLTVNGVPYYRIKYKYTDHCGIEHTTTSREFYTYPQMLYFSGKGSFSIKEDGKNSTITENIKEVNILELNQPIKQSKNQKECMYCGAVVEESCNFCSKCGSNHFKNLK